MGRSSLWGEGPQGVGGEVGGGVGEDGGVSEPELGSGNGTDEGLITPQHQQQWTRTSKPGNV